MENKGMEYLDSIVQIPIIFVQLTFLIDLYFYFSVMFSSINKYLSITNVLSSREIKVSMTNCVQRAYILVRGTGGCIEGVKVKCCIKLNLF